MSVVVSLRKDMFEAKKSGDVFKSDILSMALAAIKNVEIEKGELTEEQVVEILRKEIKKLRDAYEMYTNGGREDLASKEKIQMEVIESYVPQLMSENEVSAKIDSIISSIGEVDPSKIGIVMGAVMKELKGKADGSVVSRLVREKLTNK